MIGEWWEWWLWGFAAGACCSTFVCGLGRRRTPAPSFVHVEAESVDDAVKKVHRALAEHFGIEWSPDEIRARMKVVEVDFPGAGDDQDE